MFNNLIGNFLKGSDEYAKILIIIWLKLRDIYLEQKSNEKVSLNKRVESLRKFCRTIRKRCQKANKLPKFSKFLKNIEVECQNSKEMLYKLSNITAIMRMFDIPKPIEDLIDTIGLGNPEDNEFANVINELFEENIELNKIDEQQIEEGTLVNYVNKKYDKHTGINVKEEIKNVIPAVQSHNISTNNSQQQVIQQSMNNLMNNINLPGISNSVKTDIEKFINTSAASMPDFQIKQLPGYMNSQINYNYSLQHPQHPNNQQSQQQSQSQPQLQNNQQYSRRINTFEIPSYNRTRYSR